MTKDAEDHTFCRMIRPGEITINKSSKHPIERR